MSPTSIVMYCNVIVMSPMTELCCEKKWAGVFLQTRLDSHCTETWTLWWSCRCRRLPPSRRRLAAVRSSHEVPAPAGRLRLALQLGPGCWAGQRKFQLVVLNCTEKYVCIYSVSYLYGIYQNSNLPDAVVDLKGMSRKNYAGYCLQSYR